MIVNWVPWQIWLCCFSCNENQRPLIFSEINWRPPIYFEKKIAAADLFKKKIAAADEFEILRPRKQELVGRVFQACSESAINTCEIRKKNCELAPANNPGDKHRR